MFDPPACDLWESLAHTEKKIVLYGMGNGADKILAVCRDRGIAVDGVFASDGFVRGHEFHSMPVRSWSETKSRYGAENLVVLLSFGTSRPDVMETIFRVADEAELYAPDVPVFGDELFDRAFFTAHREEIDEVRAFLSDAESVRIFDHVLQYRLTGDLHFLKTAVSTDESEWNLIRPETIRTYADLGAYRGETVREMLDRSGGAIETVFAVEPDPHSYRKLCAYAESETRARILTFPVAAWNRSEPLSFGASGNRNAGLSTAGRRVGVAAQPPDAIFDGADVDYIKYDVEGAEREALEGTFETIRRCHPRLMLSLYHRSGDLFSLPLLLHRAFPEYRRFFLRRKPGIPAWDLGLFAETE